MTGATPLQQLIDDGTAALEGDASLIRTLATMVNHFDLNFEIMPGTGGGNGSSLADPFVQEPLGDTSGG